MATASPRTYLREITDVLRTHWPQNRTVNIVCHGHSVPSGYFATPRVDSLNAYPHLLYAALKERFPYAVINVIVTGIGGEHSKSGAQRFKEEVLCHRPDVITIDYGLNDRGLGLETAREAWLSMIADCKTFGAKLLLMTPTPDMTQATDYEGDDRGRLPAHADQIRQLADENDVGLVDSFASCLDCVAGGDLTDILSWSNHPNRIGHELVARDLLRWFPAG